MSKPKTPKPANKAITGKRLPNQRGAPPPPVEHRWKPGQSGNPDGRPKIVKEFRAKCQELWPEVLENWCEVMRGKRYDPHARNRAAELIANYAFGRPAQAVAFEDPDGAALTLLSIVKRAAGATDDAD